VSEKNGNSTDLEIPKSKVTDVIKELTVSYAVDVHGSVSTI
jgi:hypothetical protein